MNPLLFRMNEVLPSTLALSGITVNFCHGGLKIRLPYTNYTTTCDTVGKPELTLARKSIHILMIQLPPVAMKTSARNSTICVKYTS